MASRLIAADTDVVIDFLRGSGPGADRVPEWLREDVLRLTAVTAFELRLGVDFLERSSDLAVLFAGRTLPLDLEGALRAGQVAARLQEAGRGIGMGDALQAGVCLRYGLALATRNVRHFERVEGLELIEVA